MLCMAPTREFGIRVAWDGRRNDEDPDGPPVGVELGGDVVEGLGDEHVELAVPVQRWVQG